MSCFQHNSSVKVHVQLEFVFRSCAFLSSELLSVKSSKENAKVTTGWHFLSDPERRSWVILTGMPILIFSSVLGSWRQSARLRLLFFSCLFPVFLECGWGDFRYAEPTVRPTGWSSGFSFLFLNISYWQKWTQSLITFKCFSGLGGLKMTIWVSGSLDGPLGKILKEEVPLRCSFHSVWELIMHLFSLSFQKKLNENKSSTFVEVSWTPNVYSNMGKTYI